MFNDHRLSPDEALAMAAAADEGRLYRPEHEAIIAEAASKTRPSGAGDEADVKPWAWRTVPDGCE
jgi:hypothetical protein